MTDPIDWNETRQVDTILTTAQRYHVSDDQYPYSIKSIEFVPGLGECTFPHTHYRVECYGGQVTRVNPQHVIEETELAKKEVET